MAPTRALTHTSSAGGRGPTFPPPSHQLGNLLHTPKASFQGVSVEWWGEGGEMAEDPWPGGIQGSSQATSSTGRTAAL